MTSTLSYLMVMALGLLLVTVVWLVVAGIVAVMWFIHEAYRSAWKDMWG